jgi:hypothetical protein
MIWARCRADIYMRLLAGDSVLAGRFPNLEMCSYIVRYSHPLEVVFPLWPFRNFSNVMKRGQGIACSGLTCKRPRYRAANQQWPMR